MLYRQLERLETHLRRRAKGTMQWGFIFACGLGLPLQIVVWTGRGTCLARAAVALLLASVTIVPGVLMMRCGRRVPSLVERLRGAPLELCALTLHWVAGVSGPQGELGFRFRSGERCYVRLPAELARDAFETLGAAYPWARARPRACWPQA